MGLLLTFFCFLRPLRVCTIILRVFYNNKFFFVNLRVCRIIHISSLLMKWKLVFVDVWLVFSVASNLMSLDTQEWCWWKWTLFTIVIYFAVKFFRFVYVVHVIAKRISFVANVITIIIKTSNCSFAILKSVKCSKLFPINNR